MVFALRAVSFIFGIFEARPMTANFIFYYISQHVFGFCVRGTLKIFCQTVPSTLQKLFSLFIGCKLIYKHIEAVSSILFKKNRFTYIFPVCFITEETFFYLNLFESFFIHKNTTIFFCYQTEKT